MNFLRKYVFHSPVHYATALGLNIGLTVLVLYLKGYDYMLAYVNAFSVAGAVSVLFGLLLWVSAAGAFNMFGYSFSYFKGGQRYKDFYEYTVAKQEKVSKQKKIHVPYIVVGCVFLIVSFVLSKQIAII